MKLRRVVILIPFVYSLSHGLSTGSSGANISTDETLLKQGFNDLYHLRFAEARSRFAEWQRLYPAEPMGPTAEAAAHIFEEYERHGVLTTEFFLDDDTLLGGIRGQPDARRLAAFRSAIARARKLAEAGLAADPRSPRALLAITMAAGMQADAASVIEKRQLEALRFTREADRYGRRLLEAAPEEKDGFTALGASSYIIGCLPFYKRMILRLGGIQGDKQRGLDELAVAAAGGRFLRPYAKIMLALACLREKQPDRARALLDELIVEFPSSELFRRERLKLEKFTLPATPARPARTTR